MFLKWFLILTLIYSTTLREEFSFVVTCVYSFSARCVSAPEEIGEYEDEDELPTDVERNLPAILELEDDLQAEDLSYAAGQLDCIEKMSFRWLFEVNPLQSVLIDSLSTLQRLRI